VYQESQYIEEKLLRKTNQEPSKLEITLSAMNMKEDQTTHISYVEGIYYIVVPSQVE